MLKTHPRALELGINSDINAFCVTNNQLFSAIAEEVDLETVTNHELREISFIIRKQLSHLTWKEQVTHAVNNLPFGLNQTQFAYEGHYPCEGCPDAMIEESHCYHRHACEAWNIYEAHS